MTIDQRLEFIERIQKEYGGRGVYNFGGWFNNIHGVLRVFKENDVIKDHPYSRAVDSTILQAIQDGLSLEATGRIQSTGGSPEAAKAWKTFFDYRRSLRRRSDTADTVERSEELWGAAETTATDQGDRAARNAGKNPSVAEESFKRDTDDYRSALRGGPEHTVFFLLRSFYDPRNEDIYYRGAGYFWMQAEATEYEVQNPGCCYSTD